MEHSLNLGCDKKMPWYVLQCWVRKEGAVAANLAGQGFETFLPKYKVIRKWSDRDKEVEQPLFPGYVFCRFDYSQRRPAVLTPGVLQVVGFGKRPVPVEDKELEAIQLAIASDMPRQPWPYLEVGERVRIHNGGLTGLEGILINFKGSHRVVLSVSLLQRSVALEVDLSWVTAVEKSDALQQRAGTTAPIRATT